MCLTIHTGDQGPVLRTPIDAQGRSGPASSPGLDGRGRVRRTRISGVWIGLVAAGVFLILLIIFIAQNLNDARSTSLGSTARCRSGSPCY